MNGQMRLAYRLLRAVARAGLKNARAFDPGRTTRLPQPQAPRDLPPDRMQIHLFGATFASQAAADAFCYGAGDPETPTLLTRELDGAYVDPAEVEVTCGGVEPRLREFLDPGEADDVMLRLGADNSLVILTENAFGGLPYTLDDTETLTYLGPMVVEV